VLFIGVFVIGDAAGRLPGLKMLIAKGLSNHSTAKLPSGHHMEGACNGCNRSRLVSAVLKVGIWAVLIRFFGF
jgi:hypothetical protein